MTGPFHAITCTTEVCDPGCHAARALNVPRDPDLAEPVWAQLTLPLEEDR